MVQVLLSLQSMSVVQTVETHPRIRSQRSSGSQRSSLGRLTQTFMVSSQMSSVHSTVSVQSTSVPSWHKPSTQRSSPLQYWRSSQLASPVQICPAWQPFWGSQVSSWAQRESSGWCSHCSVSSLQVSTVQSTPSLQSPQTEGVLSEQEESKKAKPRRTDRYFITTSGDWFRTY